MPESLTARDREYYIKLLAGYEEVNAFVAEERRARTEPERWRDSIDLHTGPRSARRQPADESAGLVQQQRLFAKLRRQ